MENKKSKKGIVIAVIILLVVGIAFAAIYTSNKQGVEGSKNYTLSVVNAAGETVKVEATTDKEYVKEAMDELAEQGELSYDGLANCILLVHSRVFSGKKDNKKQK